MRKRADKHAIPARGLPRTSSPAGAKLILVLAESVDSFGKMNKYPRNGPDCMEITTRYRPGTCGAVAGRQAGLAYELTAKTRDLGQRPLEGDELAGLGAVVFDPPRAGAPAQAAALARSRVPVVVAVSCNPKTFARDARILMDGGYRFAHVQPIDQFLWTAHLEIIGVFLNER